MATTHWKILGLTRSVQKLLWQAGQNGLRCEATLLNGLNVWNCFRIARLSSAVKQMSLFQRPVKVTARAQLFASLFFFALLVGCGSDLFAQTPYYQGKTIRFVIGSTAGGG